MLLLQGMVKNVSNFIYSSSPVVLTIETVPQTTKKHPNQYTYRAKSGGNAQNRRAPQSGGGQNQGMTSTHEHGTRRNANSSNAATSGASNRNNAYYNNLQLPMFSSWGLPDYLAHLQSILPSEIPPPLQIRGATSFFREEFKALNAAPTTSTDVVATSATEDGEVQAAQAVDDLAGATESLTERGVKVKWPAKRMSVADMNKRVRALVEWVGREQALAMDHERRKTALEEALAKEQPVVEKVPEVQTTTVETTSVTEVVNSVEIPAQEKQDKTDKIDKTDKTIPESTSSPIAEADEKMAVDAPVVVEMTASKSAEVVQESAPPVTVPAPITRASTTKMMEELMEELISFQERFGPGAKGVTRDRHARIAVLS